MATMPIKFKNTGTIFTDKSSIQAIRFMICCSNFLRIDLSVV